MVRFLEDKEIENLAYVPNQKASNKYSKFCLGGATGLYLFVYKPNKQGASVKKYKIKRKEEGKEVIYPLLDNCGKELTYPSTMPSKARMIALAIESGEQENRAAKDGGLFSHFANELFKIDEQTLSKVTIAKKKLRYEKFVKPFLSDKPVKSITTPIIIKIIRDAYASSKKNSTKPNTTGYETASKVKMIIKQVMDIAVNDGEIMINPSPQNLNKIIQAPITQHHPALIDDEDIKDFIKGINKAKPSISKSALLFMLLVPLRSSTIRQLTWDDVKEKNGLMYIHIPAHKMKMRRDFKIALGEKAKELVKIRFGIRENDFIFGSSSSNKEYAFSDHALCNFIETIGYKGVQTPHGLRATFSSICGRYQDKHGLSGEIIETCLAHSIESIKGSVAAAYDRDPKLALQKRLFDWYAGFLESLEPIRLERLW